jgi:hypothetical protein
MTHFLVCYSETWIRELVLEADSAEEVEEIVMGGDADYDAAKVLHAEVVAINEVTKVYPKESGI